MMGLVMQELIKGSEIENKLTGTVKLANEDKTSGFAVEDDVKLMSNPPHSKTAPKPDAAARQDRGPSQGGYPAGTVAGSGEGIREDRSQAVHEHQHNRQLENPEPAGWFTELRRPEAAASRPDTTRDLKRAQGRPRTRLDVDV